MKRTKPKLDKCIFCERTDLSREHVWSEWTHQHIVRSPGKKYVQGLTATSSSSPNIQGEVFSEEANGDITTIKIKAVCKRHCNNGWMSRLDTKVMPILTPLLTGQTIELAAYQQEILATWIAMKLQVCEWTVPEDVVTPALERSLLMGTRKPPNITCIMVAHWPSPNRANAYRRDCATLGFAPFGTKPPIPPGGVFNKNTQAQAISIGQLFIQSLTTTVSGLEFGPPKSMERFIKQLWPYRAPISWPPEPIPDLAVRFISTGLERFMRELPHAAGPSRPSGIKR